MKRTATDLPDKAAEYARILRENMPELERDHGVVSLALFGSYVRGEQHADSDLTNFAVVRAIEIMGEATKNVSSDIWERFPDIPWQDMARMRDKIIHTYFGVKLEVVWDTVNVDIPNALPAVGNCLETLLSEEKAQAGCGGSG